MGGRELELYIHIPFCVRKCKYCDFLSAPADAQVQNAYMAALLREVRESADGAGVPTRGKTTDKAGIWEVAQGVCVSGVQKAVGGAGMLPRQCEVTSIYIGGGTPSVVEPAWITNFWSGWTSARETSEALKARSAMPAARWGPLICAETRAVT